MQQSDTRERLLDDVKARHPAGSKLSLEAALARLKEASEYHAKLTATRSIEARLRKDLASMFHKQAAEFIRRLRRSDYVSEATSPGNWETALEAALAATRRTLTRILGRGAAEAMTAGVRQLIGTLGLEASFDLTNPRAVARIATIGAERVTQIEQTTRDALRLILTQATEGGWSYSRTASRIREQFATFSRARAELIAVNETADAYEVGRAGMIDVLRDRGLSFEKSWITAGDDRVDDECESNEADGWIPSEDQFSSGDELAPAHLSCRCATTYQQVGDGL